MTAYPWWARLVLQLAYRPLTTLALAGVVALLALAAVLLALLGLS